jgi:hypothetical protein
MANLIAIDWDSHELRAVTARSASGSVTVVDTATVPLTGDDPSIVSTALNDLLGRLGAGKGKYKLLVAIGRGKAELRQLTLPPVPQNELPGMVRFQAMQSFSTSGDTVAVDYLPIEVSDTSTSVIAAGVAPATMKQIEKIAESASLELKRVVLRPVAAAALYSLKANSNTQAEGDCVLVDLLADDAEIVVFRQGKMIFVRSVRMPEQSQGRNSQIAGEIRRSLMACGTDAATGVQRVVIWGQSKAHQTDTEQLRELLNCDVETLDPLALVSVDSRRPSEGVAEYAAGEHTGRLAPLIGVLAADAAAEATDGQSAVLVDFLNPRKAVEVPDDNRMWIGIGAAVATVVLLLAVSAWWSLRSGTAQIAARQEELRQLRPEVTKAEASISRTEQVDQFLDAGVVWLDEFRRLAERMPPSEQAILKSVKATAAPRGGGGQLALNVAAKSPSVVVEMESSLRGDDHSVSVSGARDLGEKETYRWGFSQTVAVAPEAVRKQRYDAYAEAFSEYDDVQSEDELASNVAEDDFDDDQVIEDEVVGTADNFVAAEGPARATAADERTTAEEPAAAETQQGFGRSRGNRNSSGRFSGDRRSGGDPAVVNGAEDALNETNTIEQSTEEPDGTVNVSPTESTEQTEEAAR